MLISIETYITCDSPGGSRPPIPPMDPHMRQTAQDFYCFTQAFSYECVPKIFFLIPQPNICCGYSKELSKFEGYPGILNTQNIC